MLKNTDVLPLQASNIHSLAIIGPLADAPYDQLGTWIFDGDKSKTITPLKALTDNYGAAIKIVYEPTLAYSRDRNKSAFNKVLQAARSADATLLFLGEEAIMSGEAHSLADVSLKGAQKELVQELKQSGKPLIIIIMAGRPLTIGDELEACDAMLYAFHPGTMGGPALVSLLFGKVSPSGKLPVTFPKEVGQIPCYYNHFNTGRPAKGTETLLYDIPLEAGQTSLGNTAYHLDAGFEPLFPFGYGLSYATFEYNDLKLNKTEYTSDENIEITFTLTNSGKYDGVEVAQVYVRDLSGSLARPVRELKAFRRISLKAGEQKTVSITLPVSDLDFYGIDNVEKVEPGNFGLCGDYARRASLSGRQSRSVLYG